MLDLNANEMKTLIYPMNEISSKRHIESTRILHLSRPLAIAADNLHLVSEDIALIVQLEVNILDKERPHFVAESVGIQMALHIQLVTVRHNQSPPSSLLLLIPSSRIFPAERCTLNDNFTCTFSASTSVITRSNVDRIFIASCGSIRPSFIKSSSVSVRERPIL